MTRRDFFSFFVFSGILGLIGRKLRLRPSAEKKAMFWKRLG